MNRNSNKRPEGPPDRAGVSAGSRKIPDIISAVKQLPDVRDRKVRTIRQSIDRGDYTIDPGRIANKMISEL